MIPRHRPPFGLASLARSAVAGLFDRRSVEDLETAYARWLQVSHTVWIPSARYGIARSIQQQLTNDGTVYCPAFNCGAVFHAAEETGRPIEFVDCAADSFLIDTTGRPKSGSAVILSEMFGQRFSQKSLLQPLASQSDMRIFDMAMSIPTAADMLRMRERDVTVLSFGLGKSLFAGWGGLAATHSSHVARALRQQRDQDLHPASFLKQSISHAKIWARTAAHQPSVYGPLRRSRRQRSGASSETHFSNMTHEWLRSTTSLNRQLAFGNLRQADTWADQRRQLSEQYLHQLQPVADRIQLPAASVNALSHFCVRVPSAAREAIVEQLWKCNTDAGTLFPFPINFCSPGDFPNAHQASCEIINLPVSNQLSTAQVRHITEAVVDAVRSCDVAEDMPAVRRAA